MVYTMLGRTIREARLERSLTQDELAREAGVSRQHLSAVEKDAASVSVEVLGRIARALKLKQIKIGEVELIPEEDSVDLVALKRFITDATVSLDRAGRVLANVRQPVKPGRRSRTERKLIHEAGEELAEGAPTTEPRWTEEFPVDPSEFIERDFDYPRELHAVEVQVYEVAAGPVGINPDADIENGFLLHGREIRDPLHRVIKVAGDSMSPTFEHGWKVLIDTKKRDPKNGEVVAVYVNEMGSIIGRWDRRKSRVRLLKDNEANEPVELGDPETWRLIGTVQTIVHAPVTRQRR
jgi:transcriptional regulator with XRE-family HTH domain